MASPCEILLETSDGELASSVGSGAAEEAWRIEAKYSRYRADSVLSEINRGGARAVDDETASLIGFAAECHRLSGGLFDVTSGVLRRAWRFDGSDRVPDGAEVEALRGYIGFEKIRWDPPFVTVPAGMEIDFGGIGKEYAVDRVLGVVASQFSGAALVNFGGDLACRGAPRAGPWRVGIERPDTEREAALLLDLQGGALATSGDTHRFLVRSGVRYGHIMDVRTGWPVPCAPRSITVAAATCIEAGMLATFAMLQGEGAEQFLDEQAARYWCLR